MQKALAPDISTWPDESPQLIGSRCGSCGATTFPVQQWCPRCSGGEMSELLLPRRGTLVAWTTQGFPPGAPYAGPTGEDRLVVVAAGVAALPVCASAVTDSMAARANVRLASVRFIGWSGLLGKSCLEFLHLGNSVGTSSAARTGRRAEAAPRSEPELPGCEYRTL